MEFKVQYKPIYVPKVLFVVSSTQYLKIFISKAFIHQFAVFCFQMLVRDVIIYFFILKFVTTLPLDLIYNLPYFDLDIYIKFLFIYFVKDQTI